MMFVPASKTKMQIAIDGQRFNFFRLFRASYQDGFLKGDLKSCAGNQGTIITVEDLFYNIPQRTQIYKSASEEFHRISDVVSKYAIHNASVGFTLKKVGENNSLRTPQKSTQIGNIKVIYGNEVAKELIEMELDDVQLQFKMKAIASSVKYSSKKGVCLLFINHRLVESASEFDWLRCASK